MKKIIIFFVMCGLILPLFSFAQDGQISPPKNLDELKTFGQKVGDSFKSNFPDAVKKVWEEKVLPTWEGMYEWVKNNIWPRVEGFFKTIVKPKVQEEVEKRKPVVQEEFQKETQALKQEAPQVGQTLWERFKELIK
jgi:hypothetical protein